MKDLSAKTRIDSVDILRGMTILLMAFVNDLADLSPVTGIAQWLRHMAPGVDGLTIVDMIIPLFLFSAGISIPLALSRRLAHGDSYLSIGSHILNRTASLIIMGLMDVNRNGYETMGWPKGLWKFLAWTFIFLVWLEVPLHSRRSILIRRAVQVFGIIGLIWIAVVFRNPNGAFRTGWWGTLGRVGWVYLFASLAWLLVRNNRALIGGLFVLTHCAYLGMTHGLFAGNRLTAFIGTPVIGTYLACALAGLIIGTLLIEQSEPRITIRWALGMALFTVCASLLLQPLGGFHLPSTSWSLFSTSCAFLLWTMLYWAVDIHAWETGFQSLKMIGKNTLLLYQLSRYWIFVIWLSGVSFYDMLAQNTVTGIMRAIVYTGFIGIITIYLSSKKIRLRV